MSRTRTGMVVFAGLLAALLLTGAATAWAQTAAPPPAKPAVAPAKPEAPGIPDLVKRTTELRASLDTLHVTLDMQNTALDDAVRALASLAKVNIVLDDTLPLNVRTREVTLSVRDMSLRNALASLGKPDLTFEVLYEAICVSTRAGIADLVSSSPVIPDDLGPKGQAIVAALQSKLISFSFENARFLDAVEVLSQLTGVKMVVDPSIPSKDLRTVNVSIAEVHLASALFYVTGKELNCAVSRGEVFISTDEGVQKELARRAVAKKRKAEKEKFGELLSTPVTCQFAKTPLNDAMAELGKQAKAKIVFDPVALQTVGAKASVTAKFDNAPLDSVLEEILPDNLDYSVNEDGLIEIDLMAPKKPEKPPVPAKKK